MPRASSSNIAIFGLKGKIPLLGAHELHRPVGDPHHGRRNARASSRPRISPKAPTIPTTQKFVKAYTEKYGKMPSLYGFSHYSGAMWVGQVHQEDQGRHLEPRRLHRCGAEDRACQLAARQTGTLDDYGNPIYDVYIRKVEKRADGKYWNVPIETYPNVSQFWKYNPEEYMKQPPYSRDFQGIKK